MNGLSAPAKNFLKAILPRGVVHRLGVYRANSRAKWLGTLPISHAFDEIYRQQLWKQGTSLSGPGSEGTWATEYVKIVARLASQYDLRSAVDAGCGDFSVGRLIAPHFDQYLAVDISKLIIERNISNYLHLPNVQFMQSDIIDGPIPDGDLVMVRQVLQHLSNAQIAKILDNLGKVECQWILIAEENPSAVNFRERNSELGSHSLATRLSMGSGVDITAAPFNVRAEVIASIDSHVDSPVGPSVLNVYLIDRRELVKRQTSQTSRAQLDSDSLESAPAPL